MCLIKTVYYVTVPKCQLLHVYIFKSYYNGYIFPKSPILTLIICFQSSNIAYYLVAQLLSFSIKWSKMSYFSTKMAFVAIFTWGWKWECPRFFHFFPWGRRRVVLVYQIQNAAMHQWNMHQMHQNAPYHYRLCEPRKVF